MRLLNDESIDELRLVWAGIVMIMIVINWWGFIGWGDLERWQFGQYVFLIVWASAHYAAAATLFPDRAREERPERQRRVFLFALLFALLTDVGEAALRGPVTSDMPYLNSMCVWMAGVVVVLVAQKRSVERIFAWAFLLTGFAFAFAERGTFQG